MASAAELRAFLARPWDRLRELKDRHTAETIAIGGADEAFRIAAMLATHAETCAARASEADRRADLAAAVRMRSLLDRASRRLLGAR